MGKNQSTKEVKPQRRMVESDPVESSQPQSIQSTIGSTGSNSAENGDGSVKISPICGESSSSGRRRRRTNQTQNQYPDPMSSSSEDEEDDKDEDFTVGSKRKLSVNSRRKLPDPKEISSIIRIPREKTRRNQQESTKRTTLSWLVDSGCIPSNSKVHYKDWISKTSILSGKITRNGIICSCCNSKVSISEFEAHAGCGTGLTYQNILLDEKTSLLECQKEVWNRINKKSQTDDQDLHVRTGDRNDDTCITCGIGGNLVCCDSCPSTYHKECLGIKGKLPAGDWYCPLCLCKFCGNPRYTNAAWFTCHQCEEKYHGVCSERIEQTIVDEKGLHFCGISCKLLFEQLKNMIGVKHELQPGQTWSILRCSDHDSTDSFSELHTKMQRNSKLAVALEVMRECFQPIIDKRTGLNVLENIIFNRQSSLPRLNFTQFYTLVIEIGDEVVAAASIRIHGTKLAQMPFIGTRSMYRRQGMCHCLIYAVQSVLRSLNVGKLILPSVPERVENWVHRYDFERVDTPLKLELRFMNLLMFPETDCLQKVIFTAEEQNAVAVIRNQRPLFDINVEPFDDDYEIVGNGSPNGRRWGHFLMMKPDGPIRYGKVLLPEILST